MKNRTKKLWIGIALSLLMTLPAHGFCLSYTDVWCDYQCHYLSGWGWGCWDSAPRCCWESGTGTVCGDSWTCWECDCSEAGGF
ncbi:MAG: hypothetical protein GY719_04595 [bacterium]|nr:hypothetical protein [bacterium]